MDKPTKNWRPDSPRVTRKTPRHDPGPERKKPTVWVTRMPVTIPN